MTKDRSDYTKDITPLSLLRLMFIVMAVSGSIILLLSAVGIYHLSKDYIVERAEAEAVSISQSLIALNRHLLLPPSRNGNNQRVDINNIRSQELDEELRLFLSPFHIIKVKVFSTDSIIAYSTEPSIIGQLNSGNTQLEQALSGYSSSKIKTKDEALDLAFETRFDIDVVGTYTPIYSSTGKIAGVFEIYQDVTRFRDDVVIAVGFGTLAVLLILLSVFLISFKVTKLPMRQLELVQNKLQTLALIDSLTSVYNRYQIINQLKVETARVIRGEGEFSIILVDLDHFKKVNDKYGHPAGDDVLRKVAKTLQDNVREYDSVGRYGGEEFLIVLPRSNRNYAIDVAERIRHAVETLVIEYDKQIVPVSISAGVSALSSSKTNIEQIIKRADDALYLAKKHGRNRVMADIDVVPTEGKVVTLSN